jgi:hypothetical protein
MCFPTIDVEGDTISEHLQVGITVELTEPFSWSTPAQVRITLTNQAPSEARFLFRAYPPFPGMKYKHGNSSALLYCLPLGASAHEPMIPEQPTEGCWELASPFEVVDRGLIWEAQPGEATTRDYVVVADPANDPCLPPGEYRCEEEWAKGERQREQWYSWGCTLSIDPRTN